MAVFVPSITQNTNVNTSLSQLPLTMMDILSGQPCLMDPIIGGPTITPSVWFTVVLSIQKYYHGVTILQNVSMVTHYDTQCHWRGFISKANSQRHRVESHRLETMIIL